MHTHLEVFYKETYLIVYIDKLLNIFNIKVQIETNEIVDVSRFARFYLFLLFRHVVFVALVLLLKNNKRERERERERI